MASVCRRSGKQALTTAKRGSCGLALGVVELEPVAIAAVHDRAPPGRIFQVPGQCAVEPVGEAVLGAVSQFAAGLRLVDGITAIMAFAIFDKGFERTRSLAGVRQQSDYAYEHESPPQWVAWQRR